MGKQLWKRPRVATLDANVELSCGCDARDEPGGQHGSSGDITGFEAVVDDSRPDIRGERVMLVYKDGRPMRHARCGKASVPVVKPAPPQVPEEREPTSWWRHYDPFDMRWDRF